MIGGIGIGGYGYSAYSNYNYIPPKQLEELEDKKKEAAGIENPIKDPIKETIENAKESPASKAEEKSDPNEKAKKRAGLEDCETCKSRKYQDGSDENVSFKSASHISPAAAGAAVRGHEAEHVANAYDKAKQDGGKVLQASVSIHTSICPECGRTYVSGGTTHTQIKYPNESNPYQQGRKAEDAAKYVGSAINLAG